MRLNFNNLIALIILVIPLMDSIYKKYKKTKNTSEYDVEFDLDIQEFEEPLGKEDLKNNIYDYVVKNPPNDLTSTSFGEFQEEKKESYKPKDNQKNTDKVYKPLENRDALLKKIKEERDALKDTNQTQKKEIEKQEEIDIREEDLIKDFRGEELVKSIIMKEILDKPISMRDL